MENARNEILEMSNGKARITEHDVSTIIKRIGIPCSILGYEYIIKAVMYIVECKREDEARRISITKEVYPHVSKICNTTNCRVERCIRHAIELAMGRGDMNVIEDIFGYSYDSVKGKPTNKEFLYSMVDFLNTYFGVDN